MINPFLDPEDVACSEEEMLAAALLGNVSIYEEDGIKVTISEFEGKIYFLSAKDRPPVSVDSNLGFQLRIRSLFK